MADLERTTEQCIFVTKIDVDEKYLKIFKVVFIDQNPKLSSLSYSNETQQQIPEHLFGILQGLVLLNEDFTNQLLSIDKAFTRVVKISLDFFQAIGNHETHLAIRLSLSARLSCTAWKFPHGYWLRTKCRNKSCAPCRSHEQRIEQGATHAVRFSGAMLALHHFATSFVTWSHHFPTRSEPLNCTTP